MTEFTKQQQKAIDQKGHDILVSASAGSGKTTVLVERLMQEILAGTGVDQLLVVTFTKAAAQEMKDRIKTVLQQRLELTSQKTEQQYLRQQLNGIEAANISTIDAFCLEVIHRFYYVIDLDPSFSILTDETQAALMRERALHDVEDEFLGAKDPIFLTFYNNFAGDREVETARDLLLELYNYAMAKPDYRTWLKKLPAQYQTGTAIVTSALWQKLLKPYLQETMTNLYKTITQLLASPLIETKELAAAKEVFNTLAHCLTNFLTSLKQDQSYDDQRAALRSCNLSQSNFKKSKKWDEDLVDFCQQCQATKKDATDLIRTTFKSFYATDEKEQLTLLKKGAEIMTAITKAELSLIDRFNDLKRAENLLDYSDMEQLAYQILSQDTSESQMARTFYQHKFKEIMVDEYQDINALQEKIIQLLKNDEHNHLFMVGDVKQSIYGFRQAEPSLFLQKYHAAAQKDNQQQERILLADNFRSTKPVIKAVNQIFAQLLTNDFGGIDYAHEGQLVYGADYYPTQLPAATEVIVAANPPQKEQDNPARDEFDAEIAAGEIAMVISRIKQFKQEQFEVYDTKLGGKRLFKYSDIAILTRSRSNNLALMQAFAKADIPLQVSDAKNYFQTFELTIIMNYLRIIDNPDQDIPLVTVLRSPLFNFTEADLAKIRIANPKMSFYNALTAYVAVNSKLGKQVKDFLNQLEDLRQFAVNHRISELIWSIYERTSLLEMMTSLPNGKQRRVNLEALYERAAAYESAGFKGLYQFINFIERMRRSKKDLAQPLLSNETGDAVKLMTIHSSKGLEFPIVFYLGVQHKFQQKELSRKFLITADNVGLTIRQEQYDADTLVKAIDKVLKKKQLLEEETRIMYVGMTRARQKLILVADVNLENTNLQDQPDGTGALSLTAKLDAASPLALLRPTLKLDRETAQPITTVDAALDSRQDFLFLTCQVADEEISASATAPKIQPASAAAPLLLKTAQELFDFHYPFKDASQTTAYQSVSEIKKAFNDPLDQELENAHLLASTNRYLQPIETKPDFLFTTNFTGVEIGTATHLVLQYYDYRGVGDRAQLEAEIASLVSHHQLNPAIVPSLQLDQIDWFVHSAFAKDFWQMPANLHREVEFSSLLSASTLFANFSDPNAKILIHGTIDGYFSRNDGIILFDYKTDHLDQHYLPQAIAQVKQKYTGQLRLYEQALNSFASQQVMHKYLVLLNAKQVVEVN